MMKPPLPPSPGFSVTGLGVTTILLLSPPLHEYNFLSAVTSFSVIELLYPGSESDVPDDCSGVMVLE